MKHEDIVSLAEQAGFNGDERIYDWCYTHYSAWNRSYKQAFRLDITPEVIALVELAVKKEREECAKVCESFIPKYERFDDQRVAGNKSRAIAAAIRARGNT
jgi:hypothetical protein